MLTEMSSSVVSPSRFLHSSPALNDSGKGVNQGFCRSAGSLRQKTEVDGALGIAPRTSRLLVHQQSFSPVICPHNLVALVDGVVCVLDEPDRSRRLTREVGSCIGEVASVRVGRGRSGIAGLRVWSEAGIGAIAVVDEAVPVPRRRSWPSSEPASAAAAVLEARIAAAEVRRAGYIGHARVGPRVEEPIVLRARRRVEAACLGPAVEASVARRLRDPVREARARPWRVVVEAAHDGG